MERSAAGGLWGLLAGLLAVALACLEQEPTALVELDLTPSPTAPLTPTTPTPAPTALPTPTPVCRDAALAEAAAAPATVQVVAGTTAGSGVVLWPEGRVLTAYHVVREHTLVVVLLPDGRRTAGTVAAWDEASDLALVVLPLQGLTALSWAPGEPAPGTPVLALGYPLPSQRGLGGRPTAAATSSGRPTDIGGQRYIPLEARLNEGYSGGPVVDLCGRLLGLVLARQGGGSDAALALSLASARPMAERLGRAPPPALSPEQSVLAANMVSSLQEGYLPSGRFVAVDAGQGQALFALHGICLDSPHSYCQKVLFFLGTRYLGTDTLRPSRAVLDVLPGQQPAEVIVVYANYLPGDPDCCPSAPPIPIPYLWDGGRLRPGGVPPGH